MKNVLVIGASSGVGAEISNQLSINDKCHVIGASRQAENRTYSERLTWRYYDASKTNNLNELFDGIDVAFFMSSPGIVQQNKVLIPLIEAAKTAKLEKVVMMTAIGVDVSDEIPFRQAELALENSGIPYAIIRPNWFHQNFSTYWLHGIVTQKKLFIPAGQGKTSFIDVRDIAACAVALLTNDQTDNRAFVLTGPESLSYTDAAEQLSTATQQTITYEDIDPETFKQGLLTASIAEDFADFLVGILGFVKAGYVAEVSNDVEKLLGRPAIPLRQYLDDAKETWKTA